MTKQREGGETDRFGEFDEVGMVVADGDGSDLSVDVEVGVGISVDEIISCFRVAIDENLTRFDGGSLIDTANHVVRQWRGTGREGSAAGECRSGGKELGRNDSLTLGLSVIGYDDVGARILELGDRSRGGEGLGARDSGGHDFRVGRLVREEGTRGVRREGAARECRAESYAGSHCGTEETKERRNSRTQLFGFVRSTRIDAAMEEITHLEQYRSFSTAVQQLAKEIVTQRMQLNRPAFLAQAAPLFASLHAVNRKSSNWAVHAKGTSAEARKSMDQQHLLLQNLLFERNHLEKEITNCQRFESVFTQLL